MAVTNFSLPFGNLSPNLAPWSPSVSPLHPVHEQLAAGSNNLLYSPAEHQQQNEGLPPPPGSDIYKNNPYAPPQQVQTTSYQFSQNNSNGRRKNTYLPPIPPPGAINTQFQQVPQQQQFPHHSQQVQFSHIDSQTQTQQQTANKNAFQTGIASSASASYASSTTASNTRTYGEGSYSTMTQKQSQNIHHRQQEQKYFNIFNTPNQQQQQHQQQHQIRTSTGNLTPRAQTNRNYSFEHEKKTPAYDVSANAPELESYVNKSPNEGSKQKPSFNSDNDGNKPYPERPPGFTRVQAGQGGRTQVHAVLDYDLEEGEEDDYYDVQDQGELVNKDNAKKSSMPTVTPIQGPILLKNNTVPVVPLYSYPTLNNGTLVQIPIWWTALSVALGLDVRGDVIKGVPCIKRYHQLFCPTAGNSYPIDKIERFIDENKALMRRMYGDFEMNMDNGGPKQQAKKRKKRFIDEPDIFIPPGVLPSVITENDRLDAHAEETGESYFGKLRNKRQNNQAGSRNAKQTNSNGSRSSGSGRLDACESKIEIVTPYWASNSAGKIRAIVNTQHFEQAIHQEICSKAQTPRCQDDCGCEQKYKWHRLLAYDPDNDCKGIFMDWFLFPSCCVCRCNP
ncbi:spaetzle domain-containing protein 3 isoform 1-T3 [Glossina fuscipes fuscipes]